MYRLIFRMLFWLGCRIGEALALKSSDIVLEKATISVTKTYYRRNKTEYITSPKTESSNRKITIPKFLKGEIKEYLDRQYELAPEDRIFPITDRAVQKKMKQKTEEAKLKPIRVHDLRHPYVKHTTKNISLQKQKSQTTNRFDSLGFLFSLLALCEILIMKMPDTDWHFHYGFSRLLSSQFNGLVY